MVCVVLFYFVFSLGWDFIFNWIDFWTFQAPFYQNLSDTWARGYKTFSSQLKLKYILLINVKMPTTVGILTFISRINLLFLSFEPEFFQIFDYFSINQQMKFHAQLS